MFRGSPLSTPNLVVTAATLLILVTIFIECDRQGAAARRLKNNGNTQMKGFKSSCDSADQVSYRVGRCMDPLFDLIEGRVDEVRSDLDSLANCNRFNATERCVRVIARDCLTGIQKTATSAVASATKRFRTAECKNATVRAKYTEPLKCALKLRKEMEELYRVHTGIAQAIRDLPIRPEEKLIKTCCLLNLMDKEIEQKFNRECPQSTALVLSIVHAMTDDARTTLCVNPKCQKALDNVLRSQYKPTQNFIEPVMQILFTLDLAK